MVRESYSIGVKIDGVDIGNGKIVRDNPTIFAQAFQSMITVLSKIQNKEAVQVGIQEDIRGMLSIGEEEQSKEWSAYIQKILNTQNVPVYNKMTWVDEHNKSGNQDSKFETFMEVAIEHQTFVEDFIKEKTGIGN